MADTLHQYTIQYTPYFLFRGHCAPKTPLFLISRTLNFRGQVLKTTPFPQILERSRVHIVNGDWTHRGCSIMWICIFQNQRICTCVWLSNVINRDKGVHIVTCTILYAWSHTQHPQLEVDLVVKVEYDEVCSPQHMSYCHYIFHVLKNRKFIQDISRKEELCQRPCS